MSDAPRILHVNAALAAGDRDHRLLEALGKAAHHAIVPADADRRPTFSRSVSVSWPAFPSLAGKPWLGRLKTLAAAMAGYDLICTYNWGAIDAVLAHTLFADPFKLAPLIHHEQGSDPAEASAPKRSRTLFRRIALGRTAALVVPTREVEKIALEAWLQPRTRVRLIPDGIDLAAYAKVPKRDALPGLVKHRGEFWVGTSAGSGASENLPALVRACRDLPAEWQLVIAGEIPDRAAIVAEAEACGIEDRVHLLGPLADPAKAAGLFDLFALATPNPGATLEAMAAGLAVVGPRSGEPGALLASDNGPYLTAPGDESALAQALAALAADPSARHRIGEANRARARAEYDQAKMIDRYRALYWGLTGRN